MANDRDSKKSSEAVNGPAIAAEIMKRLPVETRVRIMKEMEERAPQVAPSVESNIYSFKEITELSSQGIQTLIREVDHKDLVISMRGAPEPVRKVLLANMSGRKLEMVTSDLQNLAPNRAVEVEEAQNRVMRLIDELRSKGKILSDPNSKTGRYA